MGIKNMLDYFKLNEDLEDDYEEYEDEFEEEEEERLTRAEKRAMKREAKLERQQSLNDKKEEMANSYNIREEENASYNSRKERFSKVERNKSSKVVPIRKTVAGLEVCIMKPTAFEDSQDICNVLLSGRACVVNLEGFDSEDAQRIMDFISGCIYAINGKLHQISKYIFIFSPESIDISGDYLEFVPEEGFEVPNL